ncbi:hypothetical protein NPIL_309811 [Nephila pilipes]|uniref:Uncharacterized protein n=1 Tax=Nephila pilipes TaxID=299642 RepID=A0A8X6QJ94_NEPPI|nr:hypothetical protein NPIL_309811 [Nephila pilipes]
MRVIHQLEDRSSSKSGPRAITQIIINKLMWDIPTFRDKQILLQLKWQNSHPSLSWPSSWACAPPQALEALRTLQVTTTTSPPDNTPALSPAKSTTPPLLPLYHLLPLSSLPHQQSSQPPQLSLQHLTTTPPSPLTPTEPTSPLSGKNRFLISS